MSSVDIVGQWRREREQQERDALDLLERGIDVVREGWPEPRHCSFPAPYVVDNRPIVSDRHAGDVRFIEYERAPLAPGWCDIAGHRLNVVADLWNLFTLSRRLECGCGKVARNEIYG